MTKQQRLDKLLAIIDASMDVRECRIDLGRMMTIPAEERTREALKEAESKLAEAMDAIICDEEAPVANAT